MNTKIVFVLTSNEMDIYLEQLWVSLYSLRRQMPKGEAHVVLITDTITEGTFTRHRSKFLDYVDEKIVVDLESTMSGLQRSRWLKTKSRELVKGDMLYIDSDTIFVDRLDELDKFDCELGAVKDCHVTHVGTSRDWDVPKGDKIVENCKKLGFDVTKELVTFNGGMVYAKDSDVARRFFKTWHEEWLKGTKVGVNTDQPSFTKTDMDMNHPIQEVSGIWNCQVTYGLQFFFKAKILHYFAVSSSREESSWPYLFTNNYVYEDIKELGDISVVVKNSLEHPFDLFEDDTKIISGDMLKLASSRSFYYMYYFYKNHKRTYQSIEKLLKKISEFHKRK